MVSRTIEKLTKLEGEDLLPNEKLLYESFPSWYAEVGNLTPAVTALLIAIVILIYYFISDIGFILPIVSGILFLASLLLLFMSAYSHYSTRYFITSERVLKRHGLVSKHLDGIPYAKIQNIEMHKRVGERLVDIGDIFLDVAGGPGIELVLDNVPDPEKAHKIIMEMMRSEGGGGL